MHLAKVFDYSVLPKNTQEADIRKGCAVDTAVSVCGVLQRQSAYWIPDHQRGAGRLS